MEISAKTQPIFNMTNIILHGCLHYKDPGIRGLLTKFNLKIFFFSKQKNSLIHCHIQYEVYINIYTQKGVLTEKLHH